MRRSIHLALVVALLSLSLIPANAVELNVSGYGNGHYMDMGGMPRQLGEQDLNDGFMQLREFSLFLDVEPSENLIISAELEIADNGHQISANYAYLEHQVNEKFSWRAGKILVPFLHYNENKPNFKQNLMSQPFTAWTLAPVNGVPGKFHGFGWDDVGVMGSYTLEVPSGLLNLKVAVMNGLGSDTDVLDANTITLESVVGGNPVIRPRDGFIDAEGTNNLRDNNKEKSIVGKLTYSSINHPFDIGVSAYRGRWNSHHPTQSNPDAEAKNLTMYGIHANYMADRWTLKGEWGKANVEQTDSALAVPAAQPGAAYLVNKATGDYGLWAWYVEGSVKAYQWGEDEDRFLRLVLRYDRTVTNDRLGIFSPFNRSRWTYGTEIQFVANARLRYEYQKAEIDNFQLAPAPYTAAGGEKEATMNMTSLIFWF